MEIGEIQSYKIWVLNLFIQETVFDMETQIHKSTHPLIL